jgi:hypothetical protein
MVLFSIGAKGITFILCDFAIWDFQDDRHQVTYFYVWNKEKQIIHEYLNR